MSEKEEQLAAMMYETARQTPQNTLDVLRDAHIFVSKHTGLQDCYGNELLGRLDRAIEDEEARRSDARGDNLDRGL